MEKKAQFLLNKIIRSKILRVFGYFETGNSPFSLIEELSIYFDGPGPVNQEGLTESYKNTGIFGAGVLFLKVYLTFIFDFSF